MVILPTKLHKSTWSHPIPPPSRRSSRSSRPSSLRKASGSRPSEVRGRGVFDPERKKTCKSPPPPVLAKEFETRRPEVKNPWFLLVSLKLKHQQFEPNDIDAANQISFFAVYFRRRLKQNTALFVLIKMAQELCSEKKFPRHNTSSPRLSDHESNLKEGRSAYLYNCLFTQSRLVQSNWVHKEYPRVPSGVKRGKSVKRQTGLGELRLCREFHPAREGSKKHPPRHWGETGGKAQR